MSVSTLASQVWPWWRNRCLALLSEGRHVLIVAAMAVVVMVIPPSGGTHAAQITYYRYHIVEKGDCLYDIGNLYDVPVSEIKRKNRLSGDRIYPGQKLIIPQSIEGVYHRVKPRETLWRIARTYDVSLEELCRLNNLSDPDMLRTGTKLFIPRAAEVREIVLAPPAEEISPPEDAQEPARPLTAGTLTEMAREDIEPCSDSGADTSTAKQYVLSWPVRGDIVRSFDARTDDQGGIGIAAPPGTEILCPADGVVVYEGVMRGYGKYLLLHHKALNLYTFYAHNATNLVESGDHVTRGQVLGRIGSSGAVEDAVLHFEVRDGTTGQPCNPLDYLSP